MRQKYILLLAAVLLFICPLPAGADNLLSLQLGVFSPGGDYPDNLDEGGDFGISYTNISRRLGFEAGMHGYSIKKDGWSEIGVVGAEFLLTFQDPMARLQPYAGIGFGVYSISINPASGPEDTRSGKGLVGEAGLRLFLDEVFAGLQVKAFSNKWDPDIYPGTLQDLGGGSVNLMLGVIF